ncbi:hypothetical protein PCIT_b0774 [Pseudoalteromonas citrea]|uniref:Thioredoxin domain-containing protein n=2 Tax=Pseudoalteromonas citrea TaxID=43655 RepID=A0AAD4AF40_9GAMM|nr:hypothetical protein PCIT_b0774 [Pseudoalteromonas citrea]
MSLCVSAHAKVPEVQLQLLLQQHRGQIVYVDFWASWCAPCKHAFIWMNTLDKKFDGKVQVVAVNMDADKTDALAFLNANPADFPVIYNPSMSIGRAHKLKGMPSSIIYDKQGNKVAQFAGFNEEKMLRYEAILAELIKQRQ